MPRIRHVALLIETSRAYGRRLLRGVTRYTHERGHWSTYFEPRGLGDPLPAWLKTWRGDGILARIDNRRTADAILQTGLPTVNLRGTVPDLPFPYVSTGNQEVGRLGAEHLLDRGFRHFGFCGLREGYLAVYDRRGQGFQAAIDDAGFACHRYPASRARRIGWEQEQERIARWLTSLPKPVGIMTSNDDRGLQVLDACHRIGAAVPDEVAVIGVENDEYLCHLSVPPLTSITINSEETGYRAAELLDRLMSGRKVQKTTVLTPPAQVVARRSTDVLATDDDLVVRAVRFIRQRACDRIGVAEVLQHTDVSRRRLEPRLKEVLGRTIQQEIRRVQIERAKELLARTPMPVKQIAAEAGFGTVQYFTRVFTQAAGQPPASYRKDAQHR